MAASPSVRLGKPEDHETAEYETSIIEGVEVHAHSSVVNYDSSVLLRIDTETTLFGKRLAMYGLPASSNACGDCTSC